MINDVNVIDLWKSTENYLPQGKQKMMNSSTDNMKSISIDTITVVCMLYIPMRWATLDGPKIQIQVTLLDIMKRDHGVRGIEIARVLHRMSMTRH